MYVQNCFLSHLQKLASSGFSTQMHSEVRVKINIDEIFMLRFERAELDPLMDSYMIAHLHVTLHQDRAVFFFFSIFTWFPSHVTKFNLRDFFSCFKPADSATVV